MGGWWRWALVSPDEDAPSQMVGVFVFVNLPLHHKVQKFSSDTGSPGWSRKRAVKWLCALRLVCGATGRASVLEKFKRFLRDIGELLQHELFAKA